MAESSEIVAAAYLGEKLAFGPEYLIPKPFDPRLILEIAPAVAKAAMDSGVAKRPIEDFDAYRLQLERFVYKSGMTMKPVFENARANPKRVVYAEGEDRRVLRAVQVLVDDGVCTPVLIGRPAVIAETAAELGLRAQPGDDFDVLDPENYGLFEIYVTRYAEKLGVSNDEARTALRSNPTVIACMMVDAGDADAMICGARRPLL